MLQLNIEFQEEYKRLDKLCKEMYSSYEGVSTYIEEMENTPFGRQRLVYTWESTYKQLKHLRWKRNQLAHEIDIRSEFCTEDDISWVKQFYSDILNGEDPLAVSNRILQSTNTRQYSVRPQTHIQSEPVYSKNEDCSQPKSLWSRIKSAFKRWFS